ncbi:MAG: radical SAM protein, partial [Spirochaetes bacterium]|nr:radical SAM protein [Spirochaetota bacterium]
YIYPLGIDYVAGALKRHEVKRADINPAGGAEALAAMIRKFNPDVIGISLRNIDNTDVHDAKGYVARYRELIDAIRATSSSTIVLGGSGFTIFPVELMKALQADFGIIGEGERMALLLDALEGHGDPASVPGVITRAGGGDYPPPLEGRFFRSFEDGPITQFYVERGGMLNLQTKRGCTYNCIYCTYPHIEGSALRHIPADEIADTALALEHAGAKYFFITDSAFNCDYAHSADVARSFKTKGLSIPWGAFLAPTKPPAGYFRLVRDAGMTHAEFGTEALSGPMLASYRKPFAVEDVYEAHRSANDAGLHVAHYLLLGGPGETRDTVLETLENATRLERTVLFFFCGIRIYPHTKLYEIAIEEGQIAESDDLLEPVFYQSRDIGSDEIFALVEERARGRENWFIGAGGRRTARLVARLHRQGHTGPLWEHMIR